jgi:hypothetical protein
LRIAAAFLDWLADRDVTLAKCCQGDVDTWLAGASTAMRVGLRAFLIWSSRNHHCGAGLEIAGTADRDERPALTDTQRWGLVERLLGDDTVDLGDRVAGCVLLVYGQSLTKIAKLTVDDVINTADGVAVMFGREPLTVMAELAPLVLALLARRRSRSVVADTCWLFPGERPGAPMSAGHLGARLRRVGIPAARLARNAALLDLAPTVPAPILARMLGISTSRAARWFTVAGGDRGRYVAMRAGDECEPF